MASIFLGLNVLTQKLQPISHPCANYGVVIVGTFWKNNPWNTTHTLNQKYCHCDIPIATENVVSCQFDVIIVSHYDKAATMTVFLLYYKL